MMGGDGTINWRALPLPHPLSPDVSTPVEKFVREKRSSGERRRSVRGVNWRSFGSVINFCNVELPLF